MLPTGNGGSAPVYGHALGHVTYEGHRPEDKKIQLSDQREMKLPRLGEDSNRVVSR